MQPLRIDGTSLTVTELVEVARQARPVELAPAARPRIVAARQAVESILASERVVYGINTGFGRLSDRKIPADQIGRLQLNLIRSHACGVGEPFAGDVVRAMVLLRANTLARGFSGVRLEVIESLLALLGAGVYPRIPQQGSVGASGDLAPLAHLALTLIGEGEARAGGAFVGSAAVLAAAGIEPLVLQAKEGLALINGTQAMTAVAALASADARRLAKLADLVGALTLDVARGSDAAFDPRLHALRPHPGQQIVAANLRRLLAGSEIRESHRDCPRVQDAYCLRCMPQVHGAARDALGHLDRVVSVEINSVTDNPLIFCDPPDAISGGNFHGEPVALAADFATLAVTELGNISERRIEKLVNPALSELPAFLTRDAGINSGFMIAQVTAAALASENKSLCFPASADTIPTSAGKEDHVSMGLTSARKLAVVVANTYRILAIELLTATQGLEFLRPARSSAMLELLHAEVRRVVPRLDEDRVLYPDIEIAEGVLRQSLADLLSALD